MKKCITTPNRGNFVEGELNKGESVCLDRCVAKYMSTQQLMQKKMQEAQQGGPATGGGGAFGM
jgi:import inner membrane translocase subunit TIM10